MPKTNIASVYDNLSRMLKARKAYLGYENSDLAKIAGVSERTIASRYKNPESFTLEQIYRLCKRLRLEVVISTAGIECRMERG